MSDSALKCSSYFLQAKILLKLHRISILGTKYLTFPGHLLLLALFNVQDTPTGAEYVPTILSTAQTSQSNVFFFFLNILTFWCYLHSMGELLSLEQIATASYDKKQGLYLTQDSRASLKSQYQTLHVPCLCLYVLHVA